MLDSGTLALMTTAFARISCPCTCPRRDRRSPITKPVCSSGVTTSTFMIGSRRTEPTHWEPGQNARPHDAVDAFFNAGDVFLRHRAADDLGFERRPSPWFGRLEHKN